MNRYKSVSADLKTSDFGRCSEQFYFYSLIELTNIKKLVRQQKRYKIIVTFSNSVADSKQVDSDPDPTFRFDPGPRPNCTRGFIIHKFMKNKAGLSNLFLLSKD